MDRIEPQARNTQSGQVIQATDQSSKVTAAVTVGVLKRGHIEAVDDGFLIPPVDHDLPAFRPAGATRPLTAAVPVVATTRIRTSPTAYALAVPVDSQPTLKCQSAQQLLKPRTKLGGAHNRPPSKLRSLAPRQIPTATVPTALSRPLSRSATERNA
jgi:hypothetical protein